MLKRLTGTCLLLVGLATTQLHAAVDSPSMGVTRTIELAAPADKVWARIGSFGDMSWATATVSGSEVLGGDAEVVGAQRRLTLKSGGTLTETLTRKDKRALFYSYRIDNGSWPVAGYTASIMVRGLGTGSRVMWSARFHHPDGTTSSTATDDAAKAAVTSYIDGSMSDLATVFGRYKP